MSIDRDRLDAFLAELRQTEVPALLEAVEKMKVSMNVALAEKAAEFKCPLGCGVPLTAEFAKVGDKWATVLGGCCKAGRKEAKRFMAASSPSEP